MVPRRFWDVLTNIGQVLEYDVRTVVFDGFGDDFVSDTMQEHLEASVFFALDACYRLVGGSRPALLEVATPVLVLSLQWLNSSADQNRPVEATAS